MLRQYGIMITRNKQTNMHLDLKKNSTSWRRWLAPHNLTLYLFAIVAFSLSLSTAKVIQKNYTIQKEISALEQENEVRELENQKLKYEITYYKSNAYIELEARRKFNKAAAGEKVIVFPRPTDAEDDTTDIDASQLTISSQRNAAQQKRTWADNLRAWRDFILLGNNE